MTNQPREPFSTAGAGGVRAELDAMRRQVHSLTDTMWAARTPAELMDGVAAVESLKSTLDALELGMVSELDATHAVKPVGWASTQDFVTAVAGGHKGTGPAAVRLAKAVETPLLTQVGEALRDGWLSVAKALVIERAIDDLPSDPAVRERGVQAMLAEAKHLDATELRKVARQLLTLVDPDGEDRRAEKGRCSSEEGAKLRATLLPLSKPVPSSGPVCDPGSCDLPGCGHDGRDPRDHGARMWDALIELCDRAASVELLPECHGTTRGSASPSTSTTSRSRPATAPPKPGKNSAPPPSGEWCATPT